MPSFTFYHKRARIFSFSHKSTFHFISSVFSFFDTSRFHRFYFVSFCQPLFSLCSLLETKKLFFTHSPHCQKLHIYFSLSKQKTTMASSTTNQDEWYTFDRNGHQFTVPIRYQDPALIGEGTFGVVM